MTTDEIRWATWCAVNDPAQFYNSRRWRNVSARVLRVDHYECQNCRSKYHRYRKATLVHHINHFKVRPDIALDATYRDPATHTERRNLISLCHDCHEEAHGYRMSAEKVEPITAERWD